ncbi:MAG: M1 family aminopeptidase [Acidobacteriota bacterium]
MREIAAGIRLASLLSGVALAAGIGLADGSPYASLRAARPAGPGLTVSNLVLERDAFRFRFESGSFQMLPFVEGRAVGAVFSGQGTVELTPASEAEARHFAMVSGEKLAAAFTDRFQSLVLLFGDGTAAEIESRATPGAAPPAAGKIWEDFSRKQRKVLRTNLQIRLLRGILAPEDSGVFLAAFAGKKLPFSLVAVDPAGLDWLSLQFRLGSEESALFAMEEPNAGFWYLSHSRGEPVHPPRPIARASHYQIETTILRNGDIRGSTTIRFIAAGPRLRVLPLALTGKLRIREAALTCGAGSPALPVQVIQEIATEDSDAAAVLPSSPAAGQPCDLRIAYEGKDVLQNAGDGVFVVQARESWYPNFGTFSDPSTFDLTYRVPKANQVVSVGKQMEDRVEGDLRVSVWKSDQPIRVAGFNYGNFKKIQYEDRASGVRIDVYTNPGTPDVVNEINQYLAQAGSRGSASGPFASTSGSLGMHEVRVDTDSIAQAALADGTNAARVCTAYFGRLPQDHVSITEQTQWSFGQSWPSLVFLPYLSFLDGTTRRELGLANTAAFVDQVGLHEFAHQWWGHLVGWSSYRDQWLSEGFAEFSAGLILEHTGGLKGAGAFWERARRWIVMKPPQSSLANDAAGPMTSGYRLMTRRNPAAYDAMVYAKGAYVLHMIRMLLRDPASPNPDEKFKAMMQDFVTANSGKSPSTRDFQDAVERHMTPSLNATRDGKADWFFQQWVYGSEIPRFKVSLEIEKKDGDNYRLKGTVAQEGVSAGFRSLLPIYVEFGKGELSRFGTVPLEGTEPFSVDVVLHMTKKPKRVVANALHDVLARD